MPSQQLIEYIKQARAAGQNDADIKSALLGAGWQEVDINKVFEIINLEVNNDERIATLEILPKRSFALRKIFVNTILISLSCLLIILPIMVISFSNMINVFFIPQFRSNFIKELLGSLYFWLSLFFPVAIFWPLYSALSKNMIKIVLNREGIFSQFGKYSKFLSWEAYKDIRLTFSPIRIKFSGSKYIYAYNVFKIDDIKNEIEFK